MRGGPSVTVNSGGLNVAKKIEEVRDCDLRFRMSPTSGSINTLTRRIWRLSSDRALRRANSLPGTVEEMVQLAIDHAAEVSSFGSSLRAFCFCREVQLSNTWSFRLMPSCTNRWPSWLLSSLGVSSGWRRRPLLTKRLWRRPTLPRPSSRMLEPKFSRRPRRWSP